MSGKTKLYIDINGTLINKKKQCASQHVEEFVDFVLSNYDCYWLSPECCYPIEETKIYLSNFFTPTVVEKLIAIKQTYWTTSKTEAINFNEDFIWLDSYIFGYEREILKRNNKTRNVLLLEGKETDLLDTINQLKGIERELQQPIVVEMPKTTYSQKPAEQPAPKPEPKDPSAEKPRRKPHLPKFNAKGIGSRVWSGMRNGTNTLLASFKSLGQSVNGEKPVFTKKKLLWLIPCAILIGGVLIFWQQCHQEEDNWEGMEEIVDWTDYKKIFNDVQTIQEPAARAIGLQAVEKRDNSVFEKRIEQGKMVKIESNEYYELDNLTHSHPYVIPQVSIFLDSLGARIQRKANGSDSRFLVTSVTRTVEDVQKLQGVNALATRNSCHLFGTTIDIQFTEDSFLHNKRPVSGHNMNRLLFQSLKEMREEGWCYVKYEAPNGVCHITVRR